MGGFGTGVLSTIDATEQQGGLHRWFYGNRVQPRVMSFDREG